MTAGRFWLMSSIATCLLFATDAASGTAGLAFVKSPQPIVAPPGDRVVFECETNVPAERIVWLHDGVDLAAGYNQSSAGKRKGRAVDDEAASYRMREVDGPSKSGVHLILRIHKNPQRYRQQAGNYQCVAWFGAVALTSLPAKLTIAVLGDFPAMPALFNSFLESESGPSSGAGRPTVRDGTSGPPSVYALEVFAGETAVLPCPPPPSDPPATITFFKDGKPLVLTDRIRMLASGNVHVTDALTSDSGQYTCTASNHITGELIDGQRVVRLGVKTGPSRARSVVLTWQPAEKTVAQLGQNVTIECAATGWPRPQIRWFRDGNRPLPVGRSLYLGKGALVVTQLESDDEGTYVCEASNGAGPSVRATTDLQLTESVAIVRPPQDARVEEGGSVAFDCLAKGRPAPSFYWMFNGNLLTNDSLVSINDHQLTISNVTKKHAGIFQCFVFNSLSKVDGGAATLEVIPRQKMGSSLSLLTSSDSSFTAFIENDDDDFDSDDLFDPSPPTQPPRQDSKKGKKNKHRAKEMIPPTKPNVTRLSDESVMVHWSVPQNEGLPIEFFKVQFKEADKSGSRWKTIDEDIPSHIRSYEVSGLKAGLTYRFRIAAVYTNNDNKLGQTSARFVLEKEPPKKKPAHIPLIEQAQAESPSAVNIYWKYPDLDSVPIDGFFIYYRSTTSAGEYAKVTVLGGLTRSHIVTHLLPDTHYDLKMQAFNMQGTSDFSRITTVKTKSAEIYKPSPPLSANSRPRGYRPLEDVPNHVGPLDVVSSDTKVTNDMLYIIVGAVLGGLSVIVVLLVAICQCRSRSSERDRERAVWDNINGMNGLNGKPIVSENGNTIINSNHHHVHPYSHHHLHSSTHKIHNGYLDQHRPLYVDSSSHEPDETAETSFCDGTHRSSGDFLRSTDSLSRHSLKRNYARNGSIPSLPAQYPPSSHPMMSRPRTVDANTLPLLQRREQCLDEADWEASVPPADSEKFI